MDYDEEQAIKFIRNYVGDEVSANYSDDEITYILDIIWEYYEKKGYLHENKSTTDAEILDEDELTRYVKRVLANDKTILMDPGDVDKIVKAELEYEESIEEY